MQRPLIRVAVSASAALAAVLAASMTPVAGATPRVGATFEALNPAVTSAVHTVALVTGDTVVVTDHGGSRLVAFKPGPDDPSGGAAITQFGRNITVVPDEARGLLDTGALDSRLFDVSSLIDQGYDDGTALPVIVQGSGGAGSVPSVPGATRIRTLPSMRALAARVTGHQSHAFWTGLRDRKGGATASRLAGGVRKVWLDARVKAADDVSNAQIGAPQAWAAGYDGTGVDVAVLDTGIDATHPDLAGKVVDAQNFSTSADTVDRFGHGTHVASIIAGSGAASGGKYKGVAPGARLLVGKVLGDDGSGTEDSVIAGMQWAAGKARVISMSLGSSQPSDGTDPISAAVDSLTASTGSLFVIAAGNTGPDPITIGSPGAAASALTVAAVDRNDAVASFSSRGPLLGLGATLKPDIAAPGVDIVAARAAGTSMGTPLDADYTSASGTSMATPHVSAAAAILAEEHPAWGAADIKGALMSSAKVLQAGALADGAGRVDLVSALKDTVWGTDAYFGDWTSGQTGHAITRTITFHNTATTTVTLHLGRSLTVDGGPADDAALTLADSTLTLPAGGDATESVTLDPAQATTPGTYTGTVTATADDGTAAHATVAFTRDQPDFHITLKGLMHDGTPAGPASSVVLYDLRSNNPPRQLRFGADGTASATVKPGRYAVLGTMGNSGSQVTFAFPDVTVTDHDVTLTADGRQGQPLVAGPPQRTDPGAVAVSVSRRSAEQAVGVATTVITSTWYAQYVIPSDKPSDGVLNETVHWSLEAPAITASARLPRGQVDLGAVAVSYSGRFDGTRRLDVADVGLGTAAELAGSDLTGKLALVRLGTESVYTLLPRIAAAGPAAIMLVNSSDSPPAAGVQLAVPAFGVGRSVGEQIAASASERRTTVAVSSHTHPPYSYELLMARQGQLPADQRYAPAPSELATLDTATYTSATDPATTAWAQYAWLGVSTLTGGGTGMFHFSSPGTTEKVYVTAKDARWSGTAAPANAASQFSLPLQTYAAGRTAHLSWFEPVLHPATPSTSGSGLLQRTGDTMDVVIPVWADGSARSFQSLPGAGDTSAFRMYVNGSLAGSLTAPFFEVKNLPAARSTYRFELDQQQTGAWRSVSTEAHTAWTFSSAHQDGDTAANLPLLFADYDLKGISLQSTVQPGSHPLALAFREAGGAANVSAASVSVSYDHGVTWQHLPSRYSGSSLSTVLVVPHGAPSVSLRVHAADTGDSALDQTILDAVRVG
nr:S8 family serine peptidase [Streptomyces sp. NBC_00899]